jgi:type I restriction enzyme S subunit
MQGRASGDYPFIKVSDMNLPGNEIAIRFANNWISESDRKVLRAAVHPAGATVFAKIGIALTYNRRRLLVKGTIIDNNMMSAIPDTSKINFKFLYYALCLQDFNLISDGTALPFLSVKALQALEMPIPTIDEQESIAEILSDIDDKIMLNQQMNKTLEDMAQALFKRWFVDFEFPDAQGRPYKSSGGKMVSLELGPVPVGWKVVPLTGLVDVLGGGTPSTGVSSYWEGEIPFFTPKDASEASYVARTEKTVTQEGLAHCNSALFPQGTVFITARGTVGKVCMAGVPMAMNQSCYALKGRELRQLYVFFLIKDIAQKLIQQSHGTVFETITTQTFQRTMAIRPEAEVVNLFCAKVERLYDRILNNIKESASLGTVRDSLLPKLMQGIVEVGK